MQKLQDSVFSVVKSTNLSPAVFSYLQPSDDFPDKTPLGGILSDSKHGWLALGPKFCVVDLRTGLKVAQRTFGATLSNFRTTVTSVIELPTPLTDNSQQLIISLECEDIAGMICIFHINGSQLLRCIQTEVVITELAVTDDLPDGPFSCFDGAIMAGTKSGEIFVFDLNRTSLLKALKDISQGYEHLVHSEENLASITFLPLNAVHQIETQRELALENDDHIAVLLNENSLVDGQYIFRNPDGTVRMKAKRDHIRVTVVQYTPQLGSLIVGFNFGAFQIWNLLNLDLEFTSQVNVECLPVTHFGFQEPCDDPRAFCYLWVVFSVIDRFDEEEFPLAVMYSLTYQGKRMLSDTKCLYQEFLMATVRFQVELSGASGGGGGGGRCVSCHTYSVNSMLGAEGEDSMLNICQLVWECWGDNTQNAQYGMLMFDLDQWYKDQMPATYKLESNAFMSATQCSELSRGAVATLDVRLVPSSVSVYCAATRLEEHFYPNSLRYDCICLNTSESCVLSTTGIQRQIINSLDEVGPTALLNPTRLYHACFQIGLVPLYVDSSLSSDQEEQRRYLLSVALEGRLSRFLKRCAHDWATGSHVGAGCTLTFLVDWCWKRAIELKENARELTAPLFTTSALPDRNVVRCLEHCVQQLTQLTGLLDAVITKCCNLVVPEALSEMEEKYKGIGCVSLYFQVVQWFVRVGLLPELEAAIAPYPRHALLNTYTKRRIKLHRLVEQSAGEGEGEGEGGERSCPLLYIDQLIENEFGGEAIHQMWIRGGSECNGLYPPPSLYSLLRLYLLPDIAEEHKHSLVLYLLVDYSMVYDEVRYEAVIRRLMQFPTMFGLSNTAIKATQAFWHLDHRDFDFALDQLQCLTGNTLSEWQHNVVLSSLLAQKKTQAALQYLHVRKPAPIQSTAGSTSKVNDHNKLEDWQSCCNLYLARGLVFEALDVIRMCVQNAGSFDDKAQVLNFFFKGCKNTGQLSKLLQVTLLPFEEEMFTRYLENCNESQTSDILIMYYLQQARYLEAEQYNKRIKNRQPRIKNVSASLESLADIMDREGARDTLVELVCSSLPSITSTVAHTAFEKDFDTHIIAPKPMSVYIQAKSPKNMFTYKSTFIHDTIENASETWINRPKARKGLKRALNVEDTPFICTPKLSRSNIIFNKDQQSESTPPKRARLDLTGTPRTPKMNRTSEKISEQLSVLLDMPEVQSPDVKLYGRSGADTPHSILKIRHESMRDAASPVDSRYLADSDEEELLETASNHTHYSDSTNKHLRFTIPTASESGSTPSPSEPILSRAAETERASVIIERDVDSFVTTQSHSMAEVHPLESPPKKQATEGNIHSRKPYKDNVVARRSLSMSINSSLSEDPNTSIESIADLPITLVNPRYSGEKRRSYPKETESSQQMQDERDTESELERNASKVEAPKTPQGRRSIRVLGVESTPLINRSRSVTPERVDSPIMTIRSTRSRSRSRSRSRTPEISPRSSPLAVIPEQPRQESDSQPHPVRTTLSLPTVLRSRCRTPERIEKVLESPRLEAISESPTKSDSPPSSPLRRSLRSRSRTPEIDIQEKSTQGNLSPRSLRSRSKTPEKLMSPKKEAPKSAKKPLSRLVLEANALKTSKNLEKQLETVEEKDKSNEKSIECTPMKSSKSVPSLMDVTISPIASKSILHSDNESVLSETVKDVKTPEDNIHMKSLPPFTMNETKFGKSVLHSYESSTEITHEESKTEVSKKEVSRFEIKSIAFNLSESQFDKSVLHSYESSVADRSSLQDMEVDKKIELKPTRESTALNITDFSKSVLGSDVSLVESNRSENIAKNVSSLMTSDSEIEDWKEKRDRQDKNIQKEKEKIVEIEREIHEIENEMSEENDSDNEMVVDTDTGSDDDDESGGEETSAESSDEEEDEEEETSEEENEVISIADSDDTAASSKQNTPRTTPEREIKNKQTTDTKQIEQFVQPEDSNSVDKQENETTDPLNQAQMSLLTDDNSVHSDRSDIKLNYSDDKGGEVVEGKEDAVKEIPDEIETKEPEPVSIEIEVEVSPVEETKQPEVTKPKTPEPIEIPEAAAKEIPTKDVENIVEAVKTDKGEDKPFVIDNVEKIDVRYVLVEENKTSAESMDIDKADIQTKEEETTSNVDTKDKLPVETETPQIDVRMEVVEDKEGEIQRNKDKTTKEHVATEVKESKAEESNEPVPLASRRTKRTKSTTSNQSVTDDVDVKMDVVEDKSGGVAKDKGEISKDVTIDVKESKSEESNKLVPLGARRTKRTKSSTSNKSITDDSKVDDKMDVIEDKSGGVAKDKGETSKDVTMEVKESKSEESNTLVPLAARRTKRTKSSTSNKSITDDSKVDVKMNVDEGKSGGVAKDKGATSKDVTVDVKESKSEESNEPVPLAARRTKRTKSTTSNKSITDSDKDPKTPTRKRSQSISSNKSVDEQKTQPNQEQKTPEKEPTTPSRTRAKTPTSEVRKIITRRASKEMSEKLDESDLELTLTPRRRSARSRSKQEDDNISIASESSVRSSRSKASEDGDVKSRRGRKSVLPAKPDLSVIPEITVEGSKVEPRDDIIAEYASNRRMTRKQRSMLESWLEPKSPRTPRRAPSPSPAPSPSRSPHSSAASAHSHDEDDDSIHSGGFDVQPIDRISLLNKTDFEGSPDPSETRSNMSPISIASDASKQRRARMGRAASEARSTPKAAKITRKHSVDIGELTDQSSPAAARGRRASFNKACEALLTPKGRRTSTDVKKGETDSQHSSPVLSEADAPTTPSRRPRRASTHCNTSQSKADTSRRTRKLSAVEEDKDTKK